MPKTGKDKEREPGLRLTEAEPLEARRRALAENLSRKAAARAASRDTAAPAAADKSKDYNKTSLAMGFRLSSDFLSAVLVGCALGFGLDKVAGSAPWGLLVFALLGLAAGVMNILRVLKTPAADKTAPREEK